MSKPQQRSVSFYNFGRETAAECKRGFMKNSTPNSGGSKFKAIAMKLFNFNFHAFKTRNQLKKVKNRLYFFIPKLYRSDFGKGWEAGLSGEISGKKKKAIIRRRLALGLPLK